MIVLDASVVLKWLISEKDQEIALIFLDRHINSGEPVAIPELLYYEVGNILAMKTKLTDGAITRAMNYLFALELLVYTLGKDEFIDAIKLSRMYEISVYDASYVTLAHSLKTYFVTADEKLVRKVEKLDFVLPLSSCQDLR